MKVNTILDYYPWFSEKFHLSVADQQGCLLGHCKLPIRQQLDWNCDKYLCHLAKWWSNMPCNLSLWLNNWQKIKICLFKSLKASQLWAWIHTLLGKQSSIFSFIVLTICILLKKKWPVSSLFFDVLTPSLCFSWLGHTSSFYAVYKSPWIQRRQTCTWLDQKAAVNLWVAEEQDAWGVAGIQPCQPRTRRHSSWTHILASLLQTICPADSSCARTPLQTAEMFFLGGQNP